MSQAKICEYIQSKYQEFTKVLIPLSKQPTYKKFKSEYAFLKSIPEEPALPCENLKTINYLNKADLKRIVNQFANDYNPPADSFELLNHIIAIWHCYCSNKNHSYEMAFALSSIMDMVTIHIIKTEDMLRSIERIKKLSGSQKEEERKNYDWTKEFYLELERENALPKKNYTIAKQIRKRIKLKYQQEVHPDTIVKNIRIIRAEKDK